MTNTISHIATQTMRFAGFYAVSLPSGAPRAYQGEGGQCVMAT